MAKSSSSASLIKDVMSTSSYWISPDATIQEAALMMKSKDIGFLPVGENDRMIGTITDRDIAMKSVALGKSPASSYVRDCMNNKLYYCYDDQSCDDICKNMADLQVSRFPVVNRSKRLVGVVSYADLSAAASAAAYLHGQQHLKAIPKLRKAAA